MWFCPFRNWISSLSFSLKFKCIIHQSLIEESYNTAVAKALLLLNTAKRVARVLSRINFIFESATSAHTGTCTHPQYLRSGYFIGARLLFSKHTDKFALRFILRFFEQTLVFHRRRSATPYGAYSRCAIKDPCWLESKNANRVAGSTQNLFSHANREETSNSARWEINRSFGLPGSFDYIKAVVFLPYDGEKGILVD